MNLATLLKSSTVSLVAAGFGLSVSPAHAHVRLDAPNGGEVLEVGSVFTIEWHIHIPHDLQNWDLWYSTTSATGPWTTIAMDLPAGSAEQGSVHTYDWTVPDDPADSAWVRVRMDNSGTDYYDVSQDPFSIVSPACPWDLDYDNIVGITDLLELLSDWGLEDVPADFDGGGVGITDLLELLANWGNCPS